MQTSTLPAPADESRPAGYRFCCCFLFYVLIRFLSVPSVLLRCWLGGRKGIRPVKKTEWWGAGVVICLKRGADLHLAQLLPLPLTDSCFSTLQIGFTFLVPAHPEKRAVKRVYVCHVRPAIYRTDFRQICRVGRTMAVNDRSEISFSIPEGT